MTKTFCTAPWVHLHSWTNGDVFPCCFAVSNEDTKLGNLQESSVEEVLNSDRFRDLRMQMMRGEEVAACTKCYDMENAGFHSMRQDFNATYPEHEEMLTTTHSNGHIEIHDWKLRYWDVRISNLCNMKCRTCGPEFSNKWVDDIDDTTTGGKKYKQRFTRKPIMVREDFDSLLEEIPDFIDNVDKLYFAGGEPLVTEEHWKIIDRLKKAERTDVELIYQSNMSVLEFKGNSFIDVCNTFRCTRLMVSMDEVNENANVIRHGIPVDRVIENVERVRQACPSLDIWVSLTVSNMNVLRVTDIHREMVERGIIAPDRLSINPVFSPEMYSVTTLPMHIKDEVKKTINAYAENNSVVSDRFHSLVNYMYSRDSSEHFGDFWRETERLDNLRGEDAMNTFLQPLDPLQYYEIIRAKDIPEAKNFVKVMRRKARNTDKLGFLFDLDGIDERLLRQFVAPIDITNLRRTVASRYGKYDIEMASVVWYFVAQQKMPREQIQGWTRHWVSGGQFVVTKDAFNHIDTKAYTDYFTELQQTAVFNHGDDDDLAERKIDNYDVRAVLTMMIADEKLDHVELR